MLGSEIATVRQTGSRYDPLPTDSKRRRNAGLGTHWTGRNRSTHEAWEWQTGYQVRTFVQITGSLTKKEA